MKQRGDNLLAGIGQFNEGAVKVVQNRNYAREQTMKNNYYRFIMQVAGFANEPIQKLWNDNFKKDETPLLSEGLSIKPIDDSKFGVNIKDKNSKKKDDSLMFEDIENQLQAKGNILRSAEVSGQLLLSPSAYSHLLEAWEIIRHRCNTNVSLDTLVSVEHSTYFARLVALRIQLSRFLSGRYYSVQATTSVYYFNRKALSVATLKQSLIKGHVLQLIHIFDRFKSFKFLGIKCNHLYFGCLFRYFTFISRKKTTTTQARPTLNILCKISLIYWLQLLVACVFLCYLLKIR